MSKGIINVYWEQYFNNKSRSKNKTVDTCYFYDHTAKVRDGISVARPDVQTGKGELARAGRIMDQLEAAGIVSPVRALDCKYLAPSTFDDDIGQAFAGSVFSNNYISTSQSYVGGENINARAASAPKPRLMMGRDPMHPYAPDRTSVLNGAGLVEDWMSDAIDLAGNERLSDGKVAIGAYETTDRGPFPGFSIIFR